MTNTIIKLWVNQIISGKRKYSEVPRQLKEAVATELIEKGYADLINY